VLVCDCFLFIVLMIGGLEGGIGKDWDDSSDWEGKVGVEEDWGN
jgi:hypothetical protein